MTQKAFEPSYTGVTKDGAEWIVKRGDIRLVGIDYMSVAIYADLIGPHLVLLEDVRLHLFDLLSLDWVRKFAAVIKIICHFGRLKWHHANCCSTST